jgi:cytochrome c oxidase subunit III
LSNAVVHTGHDHAHAHAAHHPALQHHFDTMSQQKEAAVIGMWVFLLTEILFFGGLFVAYMIYRIWYFDAFAEASRRLSLFWGGLNTAVLIFSSLTMAMGCVFLGVKVIEYTDKFANYEVPGASYDWMYHERHLAAEGGEHAAAASAEATAGGPAAAEGGAHRQLSRSPDQLQNTTQLYFSLYFTMTGLHALHMIIGVGIMLVITGMAWKGKFDAEYYTPVEMAGLYWHFVDIVWIFLFPLLYLVERHV